ETPFRWGEHDCGLMAGAAVAAMTGRDYTTPLRGRYSTARGAARALRRFGAGSIAATFTAALGEPVPVMLGHRGDICGFEGAVGILLPEHGLFVGRAADDAPVMETRWGARIMGHGWVRVPRQLLDPVCWHVPFEGEG
ncbi:DUF6950 family protein, partial [Polymorphobacter multimanifer]